MEKNTYKTLRMQLSGPRNTDATVAAPLPTPPRMGFRAASALLYACHPEAVQDAGFFEYRVGGTVGVGVFVAMACKWFEAREPAATWLRVIQSSVLLTKEPAGRVFFMATAGSA